MATGETNEERARWPVVLALVALSAILIWLVFLRGGEEYELTAEFSNASQLVEGNEVSIGGVGVGTVKQIDLGPEGQAMVTFTVDSEHAPLHRGTTATVRWRSLSSQAAREIQLTVPAKGTEGEEIENGGTLSQSETVGEVDIDQFFNTLDDKTVKGLKQVIQGFERSYEGVEKNANRGFEYLNPLLYQSRQTFAELSADDAMLETFIVNASKFSGALADRSEDVSQLVGNLNRMMNAIGDQKEELARAISLFPNFLRSANTTFVNLRATLDDVQPLVVATKPVADELDPYLTELQGFAEGAVPTVRDLSKTVKRQGKGNDLVELQKLQPRITQRAVGEGSPNCGPNTGELNDVLTAANDDFDEGAFGEAVCSLRNGDENLAFFRAYAPELVAWFDGFSHSGYGDAIGAVGRVSLTANTFTPAVIPGLPEIVTTGIPNLAELDTPLDQLDALTLGHDQRCPGSAERPVDDLDPGDDSIPFTDEGALSDDPNDSSSCEYDQIIPGP